MLNPEEKSILINVYTQIDKWSHEESSRTVGIRFALDENEDVLENLHSKGYLLITTRTHTSYFIKATPGGMGFFANYKSSPNQKK